MRTRRKFTSPDEFHQTSAGHERQRTGQFEVVRKRVSGDRLQISFRVRGVRSR